jgi:hypothetical protein
MDPLDFIDSDEGYRDIDWDSHLDSREPFFTHATPCESCGEPCDEVSPAPWNTDVLVGPCCQGEPTQTYDFPTCPELFQLRMQATTVGEMMDLSKAHKLYCRVCNPDAAKFQEAA